MGKIVRKGFNMKTFLKSLITLGIWAIAFIPAIAGVVLWNTTNPEGFWEMIVAIGVLGYFLVGLQFVFVILALFLTGFTWFEAFK